MKDFSKSTFQFSRLRVAIITSCYHTDITTGLSQGADSAIRKSVQKPTIDHYSVGGAFELPQSAAILAKSKKYDAIVPLGCLIRGETAHFDYISSSVAKGLDEVGRSTGIPVSFGVLTVENLEQAQDRTDGKFGNKGEEAALAALELVNLKQQVLKNGKQKKSA